MPNIGRDLLRLLLLALALCAVVAAQESPREAQQIKRLVQDLSRALQAGNSGLFLGYFEAERFESYPHLVRQITALNAQNDVASSVDLVELKWQDETAEIVIDWALQIVSSTEASRIERRREQVRAKVERVNKKNRWRLTAIEPLTFFRPAE